MFQKSSLFLYKSCFNYNNSCKKEQSWEMMNVTSGSGVINHILRGLNGIITENFKSLQWINMGDFLNRFYAKWTIVCRISTYNFCALLDIKERPNSCRW